MRQYKALLIILFLSVWSVPVLGQADTSGSPVLTLEQCIETALENNPGLKAVSLEENAQAEGISAAKAAFLPWVDAAAGYTRFSDSMRVTPAHENNVPGVFDENLLEIGLVLRVPLYRGGRLRAELAIAELGRQHAGEIGKSTRQDLILNLHSVFYKILQMDETLRAAQASMTALQAHRETARVQLEVGRAAPVDMMKIDVRLAEIEQQISSVRADRKALLAVLAQLMGLDLSLNSGFDILGRLKAVPEDLPDMDSARKRAENLRPELAAARLELARAEQAVTSAQSARLPRVDGFGTWSMKSAIPWDEEHESAWAAGLQANIPLYHGGAIQAEIRKAEIRRKQAEEKVRAVRLQMETDLEQSAARLIENLKRMEVNRKNITLSEETFRIEQAKNEDGKNSVNDVLDAQAAMLLAQVAHSRSVMDYLLAQIEWRRAVGEPLAPLSETEKE